VNPSDVLEALADIADQGHAIGHVEAPDAESTIKKAIEEFKITDPYVRRRLIAQLER
jgi:hypothetical protein